MKTFNIYTHPIQGFKAVKVGFSWPAFFFGNLWLLVKGLWGLAALWFCAYFVLSLIETTADASRDTSARAVVYLLLAAGYFGLWLMPGFKGNQWRERNLARRGYELSMIVQADTPDAAIAKAAKAAC